MWQSKYDERYTCHVCEIPVLDEHYDWVEGKCKQCVTNERVKKEFEALRKTKDKTLKDKAEKYDELQKMWWWLERRTHDGKTSSVNIRIFLNVIKDYFEPYEEE